MLIDLLVANPDATYGLSELSHALGFNKATCLSIVTALCDHGYVLKDGKTARYTLGPSLAAAGEATLRRFSGLERSREVVRDLAAELDVGCLVMAAASTELVTLYHAGSFGLYESVLRTGLRSPFAAPFGAPLVAWSPPTVFEAWVDRSGPRTPAQWSTCREMIAAIRARGYSAALDHPALLDYRPIIRRSLSSPGEADPAAAAAELLQRLDPADYALNVIDPDASYQISTIGSPVLDREGRAVFAIVAGGFRWSLRGSDVFAIGAAVLRAADMVTVSIGGRLPHTRTDLANPRAG
jgi:DNA-binding IclR family transcriptional regulator